MSNPSVIILDNKSSKKGKIKRFVIEDNIGEAIHLHIDNIRIDFTIKEFLEFSKIIRKSLKELDILNGYDIDSFDEYFLGECAEFLPNLIEIRKEKIKLRDLKTISFFKYRDLVLKRIIRLDETPHYKFLRGEKKIFLEYPQYNYFGISNEVRLKSLKKSIKNNGYPYNEQYIILFNGQNIIRDGQHRAVVLADLYGLDYEIGILRFYFKGKKHYIGNYYFDNFKVILQWLFKKIILNYKKFKKVKKN